ncbi:ABC transporter ATP-binding protein [Brachybacterium huguangmaarense]|uniref:ABC transporter ATP-binding protein n=1 Tax=Brachybacterium huguangmaarense TaxID=1652028 RepID=A0ABY6G4W1_9MICO|nr:ABC transporter ATP-binding protein [Brachybacterium huguangmaarense]UYG17831.1 ABC transporter ATP-binding protein [Brachybacterium huguangmaarense]
MTTNPAPAIELTGLTKRYADVRAVDAVDLTVPRGQMLALLGPNGAGKSTTTEMILGLTTPDAGTVRVCGTTPTDAAQRGLVGAMLQNGALLEETPVRTMLGLVAGVCAHPLPLDDVIERADISALLRRSTSKLSGGEAQRVRFALALLPDPDVILLDEPTVAMDVETRRRFWERMRHVAADGRTIVFATHYLEEADQQAGRVVVMDRGRIVADGTGSDIKSRIGGRAITLAVASPERADGLAALAGVTAVDLLEDGRLRLATSDSDATLRDLFAADGPGATGLVHDIGVTTPTLEDAFLELTSH